MTWTPARAPVPRRAPWSALTAAGFYVSQGRAGGLSSSCQLMRARSHSLCASAWAATCYPVTWDAIGRILSHAMNVCAPGVRTGGGTRSTWFSNVLHFSIFETSIPLFLLGTTRCDPLWIRPIRGVLFTLSLSAWTAAITWWALCSDPSVQ